MTRPPQTGVADAVPVVVRHAEARDRDVLIAQHHGLNAHEATIMPDRRTDRDGGVLSYESSAARVTETGGATFVAEIGGRVVGHLMLTFEEGPVYLLPELRPHAFVDTLFVDPEVRGAGVARRLMAAAEHLARERGQRRIALSVQAGNTAAEATYVRLGFAPYAAKLIKDLGQPEAESAPDDAAGGSEDRR
jgi:GNAT superfamily N-acetyltransferase